MEAGLEGHARSLISRSLASSTWRMSASVKSRLQKMELVHGIDLQFPWCNKQLMNFITACSMEGLKHSTVTAYLSTVRREHRLGGFEFTADDHWSKMLLAGMKTGTTTSDKRLAVTPKLLWLLKQRIKASSLTKYNKLMLWTIACFLFFGAFRANEILSPQARTFNDNTLVGSRIMWSCEEEAPENSWITVSLLGPKEKRNYEVVKVELLGLDDPVFCPVRAWRNWRKRASGSVPLDPELPIFRFESGVNVTASWLNDTLRDLLKWDVDYSKVGVLSHSFR